MVDPYLSKFNDKKHECFNYRRNDISYVQLILMSYGT